MKQILFILCIAGFLTSCSEPPINDVIRGHIQKTDNPENVDLGVKIQSVTFVKTITAFDSMKYLYSTAFTDSLTMEKNFIDTFYNKIKLRDVENDAKLKEYDAIIASSNRATKKTYEDAKSKLMEFGLKDKKDLEKFTELKQKFDSYKAKGIDTELSKLYTAKYSWTNPASKSKQSVTKGYLLSLDETSVLGTTK